MPLTSYGGDGGSDWLRSLLMAQGASQPYGPQGAPAGGAGPAGLMPGGGAMGYQAATPGQPSMGYPAMGQPAPQAPQAPPAPWLQFGGVHPGNILQSHPPGSPSLGPVFNASGSPGGPAPGPGGPGTAGNDGGFNNPYMAAAGATAPPPAPPPGGMDPSNPFAGSLFGQPGSAPNGGVTPTGIDTYTPRGQQFAASGLSKAATMANAPPGNPSQTPRIGSTAPAVPPPRPKNLGKPPTTPNASPGNPRFGTVQYQVPAGGPLSRNPIYTSLNLFPTRA